ncbi:thermophilic metalloprotease [bacterium BMS3Abin07]|nr:thermophilic metalloprotease [bacterium BMS3Abin07]GBE32339.1 thermophilic metalloprotease [bacterium BMS3Bbin05]HDO21702.1 peptidase [Nitrospirota bacterium]HDZ87661.1 peptidase [Nitrospirota bacterium]
MLTHAVREIFRTNLGIKKDEKVLVFTDKPSGNEDVSANDLGRWERLEDIALLIQETGRGFAGDIIYQVYPSRKGHGVEPPSNLWKSAFGDKTVKKLEEAKLLKPVIGKRASGRKIAAAEKIIDRYKDKAVDAVIALSNYSTSHTRFRDFLTRICGTRYASMPLFDIGMFEGAMNVDWKALARRTNALARIVSRAEVIEVNTPNGTHIRLSKEGRRPLTDTGILQKPGSFGNLPAGEVFLAPVEGTANGKLVLDWAPTYRLDSPVVLTITDGECADVEGEDRFAGLLKERLSARKENRNIAELGIGTNDRATRPDNILESEKILGTIHIALGDNSSFGGTVKTPFHQDFVFFRPTVVLIDRNGTKTLLMKSGRLRAV